MYNLFVKRCMELLVRVEMLRTCSAQIAFMPMSHEPVFENDFTEFQHG